MNKVKILFKSAESRNAFLTKLFATNPTWMWHRSDNTRTTDVELIEATYPGAKQIGTCFYFDTDRPGNINGRTDREYGIDEVDAGPILDRILNYIEPVAAIKVRISSEYTATVTDTKIVVGCQTLDISVLDKLTDAVAQYKKANADREQKIIAFAVTQATPVITDSVPA